MKLRVIGREVIPSIEKENIESVDYKFRKLRVFIIGISKEKSEEYIHICLDFGVVFAYRVGDEGYYLNWENDFPDLEAPERIEFERNYLFEFYETDYLKWFNYSSSSILDDWPRHFCIATRNDIVDVISKNEPIVTVEYLNREDYLKSGKAVSQKEIPEDKILVSKSELKAFRKWKKEQEALKEVGF